MPLLTINGQPVDAPAGVRLSDLLLPGHGLELPCAGQGRCGKCRVLARGALSPFSAAEKAHLSPEELARGVRLACCTRLLGDASVTLLATGQEQICTEGVLPHFTRKPMFSRYGVAVDIGTTTLAAQLYSAGGLLAQATRPNPQRAYGADVISRMERALAGQGKALAGCVREAVGEMLKALSAQAGIPLAEVDALVITGNTAMLYLLTESDPACLSHAPFAADRLFGEELPAESLGLPAGGAKVYLPRCISAFVGADITTALLASGLCHQPGSALLADIGTNGEMALWHEGTLTCCSTAAGPAFEGAGLSMGMPGKAGAIDHVLLKDGALCPHVMGNARPAGICGSGIVDALACLLQTGQLEETGALAGSPAVIAAPVAVTQQDVRMVQLAKSAICSGIETLLREKSVHEADLQWLGIAGGFGSYLNIASATTIGLIPPVLAAKATVFGNAALVGAAMLLLNRDFVEETTATASRAQTIELSTNPVFGERYIENMMFGAE